MRDLNGFLKKILLIFNILLLTLLPYSKILAQTPFTVYSDFHHVWEGEEINSTIYITLTTQDRSTLITYYTISLAQKDITPKVFSITRNLTLEPTVHKREEYTDLVIDLDNTLISPDKPVTLKINYTTPADSNNINLLSSIPDTQSRDFTFTYPTSKGEVSWSSTPISEYKQIGGNSKVVTQSPKTTLVNILIGEDVKYAFNIHKNLINSSNETIFSEITIPINNTRQNILLEKVEPKPDKAYKDTDGNYILQYSISPESGVDVKVNGYILMQKSNLPSSPSYLIEKIPLWEIDDPSLIRHINRYLITYGLEIPETFNDIRSLSNDSEKDLLYKAIYHYLIDNLQPNTLTVGSLTGAERLDAQDVLIKQSISTSEAYADGAIAMYRYYNIPARLVIGYVSEISNYYPEGIYHYWVEYFDETKNDWIPIDPFLQDYSETSLWDKELYDHIALIYRYNNPNTPKLPYFSSEDFTTSQSLDTKKLIYDFNLELLFDPYKLTNPYFKGSLLITNTGNTILDMFNISKSNPNLKQYIDYIENNTQNILLPNQVSKINFNIPTDKVEENVFAVVNALSGTVQIDDKMVESEIKIVSNNINMDILIKLISVTAFSTLLFLVYIIFSKRYKKWITKQ